MGTAATSAMHGEPFAASLVNGGAPSSFVPVDLPPPRPPQKMTGIREFPVTQIETNQRLPQRPAAREVPADLLKQVRDAKAAVAKMKDMFNQRKKFKIKHLQILRDQPEFRD